VAEDDTELETFRVKSKGTDQEDDGRFWNRCGLLNA